MTTETAREESLASLPSASSVTVAFAVEGLDPAGRWLVIGCWDERGKSENPTATPAEAESLRTEFFGRIANREPGLGWRDVRIMKVTTSREMVVPTSVRVDCPRNE